MTTSRSNAWRLQGVNNNAIKVVNLLADFELKQLLDSVKPRTIFNCVAYGAYSFETNVEQIYRTNFDLVVKLLEQLSTFDIASFVHAGTSSEYGRMSAGPSEQTPLVPIATTPSLNPRRLRRLLIWGQSVVYRVSISDCILSMVRWRIHQD